jgi:NTE family protein
MTTMPATRQSRQSARQPARKPPGTAAPLPLDLALQGGGSHGAYTWGVLDRLLQEEQLEIAGISGTSAGAMNAVALAAGLMEGGREGARTALKRFWTRVGQGSPFSAVPHDVLGAWGDWLGPSNPFMAPLHAWTAWLGQQVSPYQSNPLNLNPLRDILLQTVDFERVRGCDKTGLFIAATQVSTGRLRIFRQAELTVDMVLASACLPLVFQAVEIDGEAYWDGGYAGNPSLLPLVTDSPADDLLLVQINPARRDATPTSARDILDRINEVTFNASLLKELRNIVLLQQLLAQEGHPDGTPGQGVFDRVGRLRLHRLDAGDDLAALGAGSKMNTHPGFLSSLHDLGHAAADAWLQRHGKDLGRRSSVDLTQEALG